MTRAATNETKRPTKFKIKVATLILQILLPFGMYIAFVGEYTLILALTAGILFISMLVLVSLG